MGNILIVDDAKFLRMTIINAIDKTEHRVIGEAINGKEAVQKYLQLKPDLVIMDITMPDMNGIAAVKQIKQNDPSAKIIMCSALSQQKMVVHAIEAGAKDFIVKPFDETNLIETIEKNIVD